MISNFLKNKPTLLVLAFICTFYNTLAQQENAPRERTFQEPISRLWLNSYGNIQISDRMFWIAQTHIRFQESENVPAFGKLAQIYNRHALSYVFSKKFNTSVGGVLRLNFNPLDDPGQDKMVPEWRIWHEYQFVVPFERAMVYHRLRVEHRWTRSFQENSGFDFRNRWRYMINVKVPLNKPRLEPGAFYVSPEAELIMQTGKTVIDSPFEDLRLHTSFGYVVNPRLILASGLMYTTGQNINDGSIYNQRWTFRLHAYFSIDLRKNKSPLPMFEFQ